MRTVFAVDGGGSKTDAALVREDGSVLGFARGPLSHPHHLGVPASADEIDALAAEVGAPADLAVLLLAGLDFPDEEEAYQAEAERRGWATEVVVGNDTYAVLRAGSDRGWGVAVTCGAGMNCVGVAADGRRVRFPSLGAVSGDQIYLQSESPARPQVQNFELITAEALPQRNILAYGQDSGRIKEADK